MNAYSKVTAEMDRLISEKEALKLFLDWELHKAHCTMDNARALRTAANIMDNNACNGG
jgi:hypothetical protein